MKDSGQVNSYFGKLIVIKFSIELHIICSEKYKLSKVRLVQHYIRQAQDVIGTKSKHKINLIYLENPKYFFIKIQLDLSD